MSLIVTVVYLFSNAADNCRVFGCPLKSFLIWDQIYPYLYSSNKNDSITLPTCSRKKMYLSQLHVHTLRIWSNVWFPSYDLYHCSFILFTKNRKSNIYLCSVSGIGTILTEEDGGGCGHAWQTCCLPPSPTTTHIPRSDSPHSNSITPNRYETSTTSARSTARSSSSERGSGGQALSSSTLAPGNYLFYYQHFDTSGTLW